MLFGESLTQEALNEKDRVETQSFIQLLMTLKNLADEKMKSPIQNVDVPPMLLLDHRGKHTKVLQIATGVNGSIEFKTELEERLLVTKFTNFEQPLDPIAIVREGFDSDPSKDESEEAYKVSLVNSFEIAKMIKRKENKGRYLFVQKLVWCLSKEKKRSTNQLGFFGV